MTTAPINPLLYRSTLAIAARAAIAYLGAPAAAAAAAPARELLDVRNRVEAPGG
jgi:hypothetical protein